MSNAEAAQERRAEVVQVLKGRRCVEGAFEFGTEIPAAVIQDAIDAATFAPDHTRSQPWRFKILGPETAAKLAGTRGGGCADGSPGTQPYEPLAPGCAVITCMGDLPDDVLACACAVQNFLLALHVEGLSSKWIAPSLVADDAELLEAIGGDPAEEVPVAVVWFGFEVGGQALSKRPRLPMEEVMTVMP